MPRWTEDNQVWAELRAQLRALAVDELVVIDSDAPAVARATGCREVRKLKIKVHTFRAGTKIYFVRYG